MGAKAFFASRRMMQLRIAVANFRRKFDPYFRLREAEWRLAALTENLPYECGAADVPFPPPAVMDIRETLACIRDKRVSCARFGDGEFHLANGDAMAFESANAGLRQRFLEILEHPVDGCLLCVPRYFGSLAACTRQCAEYWRTCMPWIRPIVAEHVSPQPLGDAHCTRPYMDSRDKSSAPAHFDAWKAIFRGRDILIAEGVHTRFGMGNDLLSGAASVRRILCPPMGAFAKYAEILSACRRHAAATPGGAGNVLVLAALGPTATVLAYDLAKEGIQTLDAGHLDVEYSWMKMGALEKVPIPGRYINESGSGRDTSSLDDDDAAKAGIVETIG